MSFESVFPSDLLTKFRTTLQSVPALADVARSLFQVRLVLDASIVQEEIRWNSKKRNPHARSALQEAIDSGVVIPFAPVFLDAEIEEHLDEISRDTGVPIEDVREYWHSLRSRLHLYTVSFRQGCVTADSPPC